MELNPDKCAFGISVRKFLGFMVIQRGIEVNPDQIKTVLETPALSSKKELQCLTDRLAVLGCFRGASTFGWTDECRQTFEVVKRYLTEPPILSNPKFGEQL